MNMLLRLKHLIQKTFVGLLTIIGFTGYAMSTLDAEFFFSGQALVIANAIKDGRNGEIPALAKGVDLSKPGNRGMTLLWFAIQSKNFEAIKVLVKLGVNPETQVAQGIGSAIDYALLNPDLRFLTAMLDGGLSKDHQDSDKSPLLQRAITNGTAEQVHLLVERGADVNLKDSIGGTALHTAVNTMQPDLGIYLVTHGASPLTFKTNGASVAWSVHLTLERQQPNSDMYKKFAQLRDLMIQKGAKFPPDSPEKMRAWMKAQGMKVAE